MRDIRRELRDLLADKPELETALETVLEVDEDGPWGFEDIPLDSGAFGEVVSRDIVEKHEGAYRLADPEAVEAVLAGEWEADSEGETTAFAIERPRLSAADRQRVLAVGAGLLLLFVARSYMYPQVFRPDAITFLGNDPYHYRYWVRELAQANAGLFAVPEGIAVGEPLLVATVWTVARLFGGEAQIGFTLLAWYPVAAALVSGVFVYFLTVTLTRDRRIGLAALVMVAVTPVLGYRMALGFADHHAFDYIWLSLTMFAVAWLARNGRTYSLRTGLAVLGVALGVSAQVLAWNAGALLLVPIAFYGVAHAYVGVRDDRPVARELGPVTVGVALGAAGAWLMHLQGGWQTQTMVLSPTLLAAGLVGVVAVAEAGRRVDFSARVVGGSLLGVGIVLVGVVAVVFPEFTAEAADELLQLVGKTGQEEIAEVKSIFSTDYGLIAGPFFFFGVSLFFALPYLFWGTWHGLKRSRPAWIAASSYGLVFLVLGVIRSRFAGQLGLIAAVFAGLAFVHLYALVTEEGRPAVLDGTVPETVADISWSMPDRSTVYVILGVFILVGGLGTMMVPLRVNLLTYDDTHYEAAMYMEGYAADQEWEYPRSYVFSEWSDNRMYNAIVSGESRSYGYARSNYEDFLASPNGSTWYQRLQDRGFIVTTDIENESGVSGEMLYSRLHDGFGIETSHYRALYATESGSLKVFTPVAGATITGTAEPGQTMTVEAELQMAPSARTVSRTVQANESGVFAFDVATPGMYRIDSRSVTVNASEVESGATVPVE